MSWLTPLALIASCISAAAVAALSALRNTVITSSPIVLITWPECRRVTSDITPTAPETTMRARWSPSFS
jgi:hypothetical protein